MRDGEAPANEALDQSRARILGCCGLSLRFGFLVVRGVWACPHGPVNAGVTQRGVNLS